ncbi:protein flp-like [Mercenaria mercenaria]|uniref:protein flp-like n=1 Tax=Mercenaria mercenaria TaxID=6596 RepID=UPI00234F04CD|nr:protein flp-like [Mercenaria mercenaria]
MDFVVLEKIGFLNWKCSKYVVSAMEIFCLRKFHHMLILVIIQVVFVIYTEGEYLNDQLKEFEQFVKHTVKCRNIPGLAVSLVKDGDVLFSRGYGFSDIAKGTKATEHTHFCIGSLTKAFTSTLLADILSKDNNLTWNTRIRDLLGPSFELSDKLRTDHVTIQDILSHRIGTPSNFHPLLVGFPGNLSRAELVKKLQYMPAQSEFRTKFHYSNYMYLLAGHVAEVITGESWEKLVADRLFNRLSMRSTGFVDNGLGLGSIAVPYVSKLGELVAIDKELLLTVTPSGPAGSIYSTASDMAKWMLFHLKHGKNHHGTQVVDEKWLQDTYQSKMPHPFKERDLTKPKYPVSDVTLSYDMGWMSSVYRGYRKLWHSGGIVTFISQLWLFPDVNAGLFVTASGPLSSQGSAAVKNIAARASDLLLGLEPWLNLSTTCTSPAPWEEPSPEQLAKPEVTYTWNISRRYSDFIGIYGNMGFGSITVYVENEKNLMLKYGRFGKMKILPVSDDDFIGYYVDKLWFVTNCDGNINPISFTFVSRSDNVVTGLLFPIDFHLNKTLFLKGSMYDSKRNSSHQPYILYTSTACYSGHASTTRVISLEVIVLSLCLYIDVHFRFR